MSGHDTSTENPPRFALLHPGAEQRVVARYLPSNYEVERVGEFLVILGRDSLGWTLDGYVLPRLVSGMIAAHEISLAEYRALLTAAMLARKVAFKCPECGRSWNASDDPDEYAYGHDCEV